MIVEYLAGELRTGRRLTQLPVTSGPFEAVLNEPGSITVTIPLQDQSVGHRNEILAQVEPCRSFLAVQVGDRIVEAGPIWAHDLDEAGNLTVKALGLWSLWDHRLAVTTSNVVTRSLSWSGLSLGTIAKRLVSSAMSHTGGSLPLVLPADETGPHERTYPGYELARVSQRLSELVNVEGGPDIAFEPRLTTDRLGVEWVMRTGTVKDPLLHQTGADWQWDASTPRGGVHSVRVSVDASSRANRVYASGDGFETSTLLGSAFDAEQWARGYPLLEDVADHSTVTRVATLNAHARARVQAGSAPWTTWTVRVSADAAPVLGVYRPGDWVTITPPRDHVYLRATRPYRARVGKVSSDETGRFVDVTLLPTLEAR